MVHPSKSLQVLIRIEVLFFLDFIWKGWIFGLILPVPDIAGLIWMSWLDTDSAATHLIAEHKARQKS